MTDHQPAAQMRTRTLYTLILDDEDETPVIVDHVYLAEGAAGECDHCGKPVHDPGMVGLIVGQDNALITAEQALTLANRLTRAANLIYEPEEEPPDIEREAARLTTTQAGE